MPLTLAGIGEVNTIRRVGGNEETRRFLENLGFLVGTKITVLSAIGGNVIVNVRDSRVAINADMARHIVIGGRYSHGEERSCLERRCRNDIR